ncbi:DJ-1/PfpI family protein [bacterium]|nr:DJ-1/PfpI family protein [bacterium]
MKKALIILTSLIFILTLSGCGQKVNLENKEASEKGEEIVSKIGQEEKIVSKTSKDKIEDKFKIKEKTMPKKALMIIAFKNFRDEEYLEPKEILENGGVEITTASSQLGEAKGSFGNTAKVDLTLEQVNVADYDGVIFVGGPGAVVYQDNTKAQEIARKAVEQDKILAAICIAPTILAKAGVLSGRRATVWTNVLDKSAAKILEENGATFVKENVVQDGKIITANGPGAAKEFGRKILEEL